MTRVQLIDAIARSIAEHEGYHVTAEAARRRGIAYPTRAQRNHNPGNIRRWSRNGKPFPVDGGYAVFPDAETGWSVLRALIGQYVDGKYHNGQAPTLRQFFAVYAPAEDANNPLGYAAGVAKTVGMAAKRAVGMDEVLKSLIVEE